jgi:hypothetical protein
VEDPYIKVLYNRRGVSDYVLYDEAGIEEKTGVPPSRYVPYAALRGDTSDNLPGIAGVGEKTAAKLINTYGGIEGIFEHLDEQTPKLRASLADPEVQARVRSNEQVMQLVRDAPVELQPDDLHMGTPDAAEVKRLFDFLEFRTLYDRLYDALATLAWRSNRRRVVRRGARGRAAPADGCGVGGRSLTALAAAPRPRRRGGRARRGEGPPWSPTRRRPTWWIPGEVLATSRWPPPLRSRAAGSSARRTPRPRWSSALALRRRCARLAFDTASRLPADPADTLVPARGARYAHAGLPAADGGARASSTSTGSRRPRPRRARGARCGRSARRADPRGTARSSCVRSTTTSRSRSFACSPRWRSSAWRRRA